MSAPSSILETPVDSYFTQSIDFTARPKPKLEVSGDFLQQVSYYLQRLGSYLKVPAFFLTEKAIRCFSPIRPNQFDQGSKLQEYAGRYLVLALLVLAMIPAPGTAAVGAAFTPGAIGAFGLAGCALKLAARYIDRRDYLHMQVGEPQAFNGDRLNVVSANICAFGAGFSYVCGGLIPFNQRVDRLVTALTQPEAGSKSPDVLMLQEVWGQSEAQALIDRLSRLGYCEFYFSIGDGSISPGSALFVASRHKLENPKMQRFDGIGTFDMQRCYFSVELPHSSDEGRKVRLMTTHPAPSKDDLDPKPQDKALRRAQLKQVFKDIKKGERVILAGDFNMMPEELDNVLSQEASHLLMKKGDNKSATCTQNLGNIYSNDPEVEDVRLDYMLTQGLDEGDVQERIISLYKNSDKESSVDTQTALSDHHAVSLSVKV